MHMIALHAVAGGTGRTTLALALASAFASQQRRVLVLDATRPGHIPRWRALLAGSAAPERARDRAGDGDGAQGAAPPGGRDRLSRRVRLARAGGPEALERALHLARDAGLEITLIDGPGLCARAGDPLTADALRAAHLALIPVRTAHDLVLALREMGDIAPLPAAALLSHPTREVPRARPRALRAAWEARGGPPEALLRTALAHRPAFEELGPPPWLHARHADLLAREGGRRPDLFGAGPDVTALFERQPFDPARLADHAGAVREANALAAEVLFRLEGLALAPLAPAEEEAERDLLPPLPAATAR